MGKYIRKSKTTWEVAVMEVTHSSHGVRTRAKTLALQRLQKSATAAATPPTTATTTTTTPSTTANSGGSYLQLRNRRLEKPPSHDSKRQKLQNPRSLPNTRASSRLRIGGCSEKANSVPADDGQSVKDEMVTEKVVVVVDVAKEEEKEEVQETEANNNVDSGIEASFGENVLDLEGRERSTRESTPCSLIRDPDTVRTPGSTTRPTSSPDNRRIQNSARRNIPTAHEMNEFFAAAEEEEQRQFIEKYNFDPVNDKPLPGRYEWVKLDP